LPWPYLPHTNLPVGILLSEKFSKSDLIFSVKSGLKSGSSLVVTRVGTPDLKASIILTALNFSSLVDATELLEYFFVLIAGRPEILSDERRGLKSYEALWMRLQTGLISSEHFNRFADMVDIERLIRDVGGIDKFAKDANDRLREIIEKNNLDLKYKNTPSLKTESPLRQRLSETANMITKGGEDVNL